MLPDWTKAPAWAQYVARAGDNWYWYDRKPMYDGKLGWWGYSRSQMVAMKPVPDKATLMARPTK